MSTQARVLIFLALVQCAGCSKAELSEARKNYLLARDHGWIDVVVQTPPAPRGGENPPRECTLTVMSNGESLLFESADFRAAAARGRPIGYRFPAAVGSQDLELRFARCLKDERVLRQKLDIKKDELVQLSVQGSALETGSATPYRPATLDGVSDSNERLRAQVETLAAATGQATSRTSTLSWLVVAALMSNVVTLLVLLLRRRPRT
jgi:hypothetical protein